jgi:hypothetical protein
VTEEPEEPARPWRLLRDVPSSFLSPAERKKRRPKVELVPMFDEPDHDAEFATRASYRRTRDAGKPRTFRDEVKRRREERERRERDLAREHDQLNTVFWTTQWWTWTWSDEDGAA